MKGSEKKNQVIMANSIIEGNGFTLRHLMEKDIDSIAKHANDTAIARNTLNIPHPYTKEHAKSWISKKLEEYTTPDSEEEVFCIDINGEAVGAIGIHGIKKGHKAEIGYWLSKEHRGKGIMSEAVKLLTDYGFKKYELVRIDAFVFHFNAASSKVLEKKGYKEEGLIRKYHLKDGKPVDARLYSIIR